MAKKILVTGATGFIGQKLCAHLAESRHEIVALSRFPEKASEVLPSGTNVYLWQSHESEPPSEAFQEIDAVIHLAGENVAGRWTKSKQRAIHDSRVIGTRKLIATMRAADATPEVFISASAIGFYGDRADEVLTEESTGGSDFLAGVCAGWETAAQEAMSTTTRVVKLRTGIVLGRGGGALGAMKKIFALGMGGPIGSGKQWWSWIHISDLLNLIDHCLEHSLEGPINATSPNPVRQKDFAKAMGKALKRPAFMPAPAFAIKTVLGGFSTELLSSKNVLPNRALSSGYTFQYPEIAPALTDILTDG